MYVKGIHHKLKVYGGFPFRVTSIVLKEIETSYNT